mgnify:CR=1 FL=1
MRAVERSDALARIRVVAFDIDGTLTDATTSWLGPELGWLGFTPAAAGRPMSNTIYIGLFMGFYFGS